MELATALKENSPHSQLKNLDGKISISEFIAAVLHVGTRGISLENQNLFILELLNGVLKKVYDQTRRKPKEDELTAAISKKGDDFVYSLGFAVAFARTPEGRFTKLFVSEPSRRHARGLHAEEALLRTLVNECKKITRIGVSMSPCSRCVVNILSTFHDNNLQKLEISFLVVYGKEKSSERRHALKNLQLLRDLNYKLIIDDGICENGLKHYVTSTCMQMSLCKAIAKFKDRADKHTKELDAAKDVTWSGESDEKIEFGVDSLVIVHYTGSISFDFGLADTVFDTLESNHGKNVTLVLFYYFPSAAHTLQLIHVLRNRQPRATIWWYSGPEKEQNKKLLKIFGFSTFKKVTSDSFFDTFNINWNEDEKLTINCVEKRNSECFQNVLYSDDKLKV